MKTSIENQKIGRPFIVFAPLILALALVVTAYDFVYLQGLVYRPNIIAFTGLTLFVLGIVMFAIGKRTLGKSFSYGLKTLHDHKLVTHGIYKHTRHPVIFASIICPVGIPLIFSSLYGFLLMLTLVPLFLYRMLIEERLLIERFGDDYRQYMKRTKRLVPFVY
jgi:protein-S-isoprenylcysteine O-methyltransferase Ste14